MRSNVASLPCSILEAATNRLAEAGVRVGDDQAHPGEPAFGEAGEEPRQNDSFSFSLWPTSSPRTSRCSSASIWMPIVETVDFEIPLSPSNPLTRSSTFRVEVPPVRSLVHRPQRFVDPPAQFEQVLEETALAELRNPDLGIPPGVHTNIGRSPVRCATRARPCARRGSHRAATVPVSSASISSFHATVRMSRRAVYRLASVSSRRVARSDRANS